MRYGRCRCGGALGRVLQAGGEHTPVTRSDRSLTNRVLVGPQSDAKPGSRARRKMGTSGRQVKRLETRKAPGSTASAAGPGNYRGCGKLVPWVLQETELRSVSSTASRLPKHPGSWHMNPLGNPTRPSRDLDRFEVGHPYTNSTPSNGSVTCHGAKSRRSTHFAVLDAGRRRSPDLDGSTIQTPQARTPAGEVGDPGRNHALVIMQGTTTGQLLTTLPGESGSFGCGSSFRDPSLRLRRRGQHRTGDHKQQAQQGTHRHDRPLSRQRGGHPNVSFSLSRGMTALGNLYSLLFGRNWWTDQQ